ncbi:MAG: ABC transporter permease [Actinomycetia bacterium]|nr:ABC transporter permease [Actinomycetes bacterium]
MTIDVTPRPSVSPPAVRAIAHARLEFTMLARNGEQLVLTVVLPVGLLLVLTLTDIIDVGGSSRVDRLGIVVPSMVALAVLSTSFTALAIQTGFERRYGVLRRIGTTPLTRFDVLTGKALAVLAVEAAQVTALGGLGWALGWRPDPVGLLWLVPLVLLGSAALASLALLLAGVVRAEATLAGANLAYLILASAGVVVPVAKAPTGLQPYLELLPSAALAESLRIATINGTVRASLLIVLVLWLVAGACAVSRWFRWD